MKKNKWLLPLMSILLVFFLVACKPAETLDVDALLTKAEQQVELLDKVNSDITLPTTVVIDGLTIDVTWSSNNPNVISALGVVTRPTQATGDMSVTLTATFTYREKEKIGNFTVVVESLPELTVSFNTNGGSMIPPITVGQGETIGAPLAPTKANHEFVGWYKDTNLTNLWNFSSDVISSSLSLYAKWQENEKYAVTFQKNNGDTDVVIQVYADQKINPISAPVKSGYTFSYWAKNDSIENDGQEFVLLPDGEYNFTVTNFERGRFPGGAKVPACNKASITVQVDYEGKIAVVKFDLLLYRSLEWRISSFFRSIGQKKHGEKLMKH